MFDWIRRPVLRTASTCAAIALSLASYPAASAADASLYGPGDSKLAAPTSTGGPIDPFLTNGEAVLRALDAIAARSGRPLRVTAISANNVDGLTVDVQEPAHHVNVDRYVVAPDGTIADPKPVQVDPQAWDSEANVNAPVTAAVVDRQAFDPTAIAFSRLEQTAREAIAKSGFTDARVVFWEFKGVRPASSRWIYLEAARGKPTAQVDVHLKIVNFEYS
jgi:hypothetical protein